VSSTCEAVGPYHKFVAVNKNPTTTIGNHKWIIYCAKCGEVRPLELPIKKVEAELEK
jgi:hypothetical protein